MDTTKKGPDEHEGLCFQSQWTVNQDEGAYQLSAAVLKQLPEVSVRRFSTIQIHYCIHSARKQEIKQGIDHYPPTYLQISPTSQTSNMNSWCFFTVVWMMLRIILLLEINSSLRGAALLFSCCVSTVTLQDALCLLMLTHMNENQSWCRKYDRVERNKFYKKL